MEFYYIRDYIRKGGVVMMSELTIKVKKFLQSEGADLIGIGDLSGIKPELRRNMPIGICLIIAYPAAIIKDISKAPTMEYLETYNEINKKLDQLVIRGAEYLHSMGYEALPQTTSIVKTSSDYATVLPYKTVATRSGLGWIGKCALLVTKEYGSAIRLSTILTNAPLETSNPINESKCSDCMICTKACPAQAVKGNHWSINTSREEYYDAVKCRKKAREISKEVLNKEISLCGKCIVVCPYTQAYIRNHTGESS